jgi:hypothetical protein
MTFAASPLARALDAKIARYVQWEKPLRSYRGQKMRRVNEGGLSWEEFDRELTELEASLVAKYDPRGELHPLFGQLCDSYLGGDGATRDAMRAYVAERKTLGELLWRYANSLGCALRQAEDEALLQRALIAVAIENCASDYRDTLMTLADLYVAAEEAGLEPQSAFDAAAALAADDATPGGCESLARMLGGFHESSVLVERRGMRRPYGGPT